MYPQKKILYLMSIDWNWIKQRPQFLAQELENTYSVDVFFLKEIISRMQLQANKKTVNKCKHVWAIPFRDKNCLCYWIQKLLFACKIRKQGKYDVIWVTHPLLVKYVSKWYKGVVIYDCMDNHEEMCYDKKIKIQLLKDEKRLINRSDVIFSSSEYLQCKIQNFFPDKNVILLRNGFEYKKVREPQVIKKKHYKIGYIGTLSAWFDMQLLLESIKRNSKIDYHLLGPMAEMTLPQVKGIYYDGVCEHSQLYGYSEDIDCLVMPFVINDLVEAVDPVKLYEYISMGKCIVSVYYAEIARFEPFVYFYHNYEEYVELIDKLVLEGFPTKYTAIEQKEFLEKSSWKIRGNIVSEVINKQLNNRGI